uniref:Uncharacterized protein n=1 Tax=Oryza brachyantha TaxID=4533 RepID=J3MG19_ORYBR
MAEKPRAFIEKQKLFFVCASCNKKQTQEFGLIYRFRRRRPRTRPLSLDVLELAADGVTGGES